MKAENQWLCALIFVGILAFMALAGCNGDPCSSQDWGTTDCAHKVVEAGEEAERADVDADPQP